MRVLITGGGTGGHILPAFNIGRELKKRGVKLFYVGSVRGLEAEMEIGFPYALLPVSGWVRKSLKHRILFFPDMLRSVFKSVIIINRFKPDAVLSTGGFVSIPVLLVSIIFGIPVFLVEINTIPGLAVRLFSYFAFRIYVGFERTREYLPHHNRILVAGIPVRSDIGDGDSKEAIKFFKLNKEKKTLLIFGGSRGADFLNRLSRHLHTIMDKEWQFIILGMEKCTGLERVRCFKFLDKMEYAYAVADVVISRGGGMTIGELLFTGLPAIIIPYPYAYLDHQYHNAKEAEKMRRNIKVVREEEATPELIKDLVEKLYGKKEKIMKKSPSTRIAEEMIKYVWRD